MYYCDNKHIIVFASSFAQKALILKTKLIIEKKKKNDQNNSGSVF